MFNKNNLSVENNIFEEKLIKELPSKTEGIRENELCLVITPSENLYRVIIWDEDIDEYFEDMKEAKELLTTKSSDVNRDK